MKKFLEWVVFVFIINSNIFSQFNQISNRLTGPGDIRPVYLAYSTAISSDGSIVVCGQKSNNTNEGALWIFTKENGTFIHRGNKILGTGSIGAAEQGGAVAISADGNTVISGGSSDDSGTGAAWIFYRTNREWRQQGEKIMPVDATGKSYFGSSVAISDDGNLVLVGGYADNNGTGAAWLFQRTNGIWKQCGNKLVGSGGVGTSNQALSVALSGDGTTAVVGGGQDNSSTGAAWIFVKKGDSWVQEGAKLVGTGNSGTSFQGRSVAISNDGNTVLVGGTSDHYDQGATWVFTRTNGVWSQQGNKLFGENAVSMCQQGMSVSLSADGNTAFIGAPSDSLYGAVWVFTRTNSTWTQMGSKLLSLDRTTARNEGSSVRASADGKNFIMSGYLSDLNSGAAWVFCLPGIVSPGSADIWKVNTIKKIVWSGLSFQNAHIEYSSDGGASWAVVSASTPVSTGYTNWKIPNTPTENALVRISDAANPATFFTSSSFFIKPANTIVINEDFYRANYGGVGFPYSADISANLDSYTSDNGWNGAHIYQAGGALLVGQEFNPGYLETPSLNLSAPLDTGMVKFSAMNYPGDTIDIQILFSADSGATYTQIGRIPHDSTLQNYSFTYMGGTENSKIKIQPVLFDGSINYYERFYLDNIIIGNSINTDIRPYPGTPSSCYLRQNYPNPFNPATRIEFSLSKADFVTLKVYNVQGSLIATLVNKYIAPGFHSVVFNANSLPSGVYYYRLTSSTANVAKKMLLLK